jgi:hypothetical protein
MSDELKRCRNKQCREALTYPTANRNHAFHAKGCYEGFYAKRCLVCEGPKEGRKVCNNPACKSALKTAPACFGYIDSPLAKTRNFDPRSAHSTGIKIEVEPRRARSPRAVVGTFWPDRKGRHWRIERLPGGHRIYDRDGRPAVAFRQFGERWKITYPRTIPPQYADSLDDIIDVAKRVAAWSLPGKPEPHFVAPETKPAEIKPPPVSADASDLIATIPADLSIPQFLRRA